MKIIHILDMIIDKLRALNRKVDSNMEEVQQSIIETKESEIEYKEELEELAEQIVEQTKEYSESAEANAEQTAQDREYVEGAVTTVEEYSESARHSMQDALLSEQACLSAKEAVTTAKGEVEGLRVLTESYAKGGTGSRTGEDTDNAEYYYEKTREIAEGFEVIDNLTSTSATKALSANMGRELKSQLEDFKDEKGEPNGYAELDSNGRVPYSQLPESAMEFKGTWNASTNTPTLTQGVGTNGDFYVVSVGGTWQGITFIANERIIFDGSAHQWIRLSASGEVVASNVTYNNTTSGLLATNVQNAIDEVNSENLIPYPYYHSSQTMNGVTFTIQKDGTIKTSGTATADIYFNCAMRGSTTSGLFVEKGKHYTLSGCPSGGSNTKYYIGLTYNRTNSESWSANDYGNGLGVDVWDDYLMDSISIFITIKSGQNANNLIFKPMLVRGSNKQTYKPTTTDQISLQNRLGSLENENLIPYPYYRASGFQSNGITYTLDSNGNIIANGTVVNSTSYFSIYNSTTDFLENGKTYTLSLSFSGSGIPSIYINNGSRDVCALRELTKNSSLTFTHERGASLTIGLYFGVGKVCSNLKMSVMLEEGTVAHEYKPTTESLTNKVNKSDLLNLIYPVGSLYMSVNNTSPQTLFGGTWQQIKDRFLLSAGDTYTAGSTGGSATHTPSGTVENHTLTIDEMPSHAHNPLSDGRFGINISANGGLSLTASTDVNTAAGSTSLKGGGQAHNHPFTGTAQNTMPPYLTVYVWKRTA